MNVESLPELSETIGPAWTSEVTFQSSVCLIRAKSAQSPMKSRRALFKWRVPFNLPHAVFLAVCLCLLRLCSRACANENLSASAESPSLEQIPDRFRECDDAILLESGALLAAIEGEMSAKRISEPLGQALRLRVCKIKAPISAEVGSLARSSLLPPENATLAKAVSQFQATLGRCGDERAALIQRAVSEVARRTADVARNAKSAEEVEALYASIDRLRELARWHTGDRFHILLSNSLLGCTEFLGVLREALESPLPEKIWALRRLRDGLHYTATLAKPMAGEIDVSQWLAATIQPLKSRLDETRKAMEAALLEQKTEAFLFGALGEYENANREYQWFDPPATHPPKEAAEMTHAAAAYQKLAYSVVTIERHRWLWAVTHIERARKELVSLGTEREAVFGEFLTKLEREVTVGTEADKGKQVEELRAKLNGAQTPVQLEEIASKLSEKEQLQEKDGAPFFFKGLGATLESIAASWSEEAPVSHLVRGLREGSAAFSEDLEQLSQRIERDLLRRSLRMPEINRPPLAGQPLAEALEIIRVKLAGNGEWQRVIEVLKAQMRVLPEHETEPGSGALIGSIREFLSGRNFELAEDWSEAAAAYRKVMRDKLTGAPVREAGERLEMLKKAHPEAAAKVQ